MNESHHGSAPAGDYASLDDLQAARLEVRFEVPRLRAFSDLLARSVALLGDNVKILLLISLILIFPFDVVMSFCDAFTDGEDLLNVMSSLASLAQDIVIALATPAGIYAMFIRLRDGREVGLSESLAWGGAVFLRYLGFQIVVGLITLLGLLLLIVPGVIFGVWYSLVGVIVTVEGKRHPGVLARSKALTEGKRGWIFVFYVLMVIFFLALAVPVGLADEWLWSSATEIWSIYGVVSFGVWLSFSVVITGLMWLIVAMSLTVYMDGVGEHLMECPGCGYNLTGNISGACAECGQIIPDEARRVISNQQGPVDEAWSV